MKLPIEFEKRMQALLGGQYPAFRTALTEGAATKGLICGGKITPGELAGALPVTPLTYGGFTFSFENPGKHPLHHGVAFTYKTPLPLQQVPHLHPGRGGGFWTPAPRPAEKASASVCVYTTAGCLFLMKFPLQG